MKSYMKGEPNYKGTQFDSLNPYILLVKKKYVNKCDIYDYTMGTKSGNIPIVSLNYDSSTSSGVVCK